MKAEVAKRLPIDALLRQEGFNPEKVSDDILWYKSPFRPETSPSFKVNRQKNLWYDFGMGEGGDVINFIMKFKKLPFIQALHYLEPMALGTMFLSDAKILNTPASKSSETGILVLTVKPLVGGPLLEYLHSRAICDNVIIGNYCNAVTYRCRDRKYFAVGFRNDSGGYELRSKYAKLASAPKDISTIFGTGEKHTCHVFEGFIDFLSFLTLNKECSDDCIVLNSISMVKKAMSKLQQYQRVELYLDNDDTGRSMTKQLEETLPATDKSTLYAGCKDLNEYLCSISNLKKQ